MILSDCNFMGQIVSCLHQFESHAENSVFVIMAYNLECPYFGGVFYVLAYAEAFIIIAYFYDSYGFGSIFGQTFHIEAAYGFLLGDKFHRDGQIAS